MIKQLMVKLIMKDWLNVWLQVKEDWEEKIKIVRKKLLTEIMKDLPENKKKLFVVKFEKVII